MNRASRRQLQQQIDKASKPYAILYFADKGQPWESWTIDQYGRVIEVGPDTVDAKTRKAWLRANVVDYKQLKRWQKIKIIHHGLRDVSIPLRSVVYLSTTKIIKA